MSTLFTIGYGNRSPDDFYALLDQNKIGYVIDLRRAGAKAWCRAYYPDSIRNRMSASRYKHYTPLANYASSLSEFKEQLQSLRFLSHILNLSSIVLNQESYGVVCCLLCSEMDPDKCHRKIVAEAVVETLNTFTSLRWELIHL